MRRAQRLPLRHRYLLDNFVEARHNGSSFFRASSETSEGADNSIRDKNTFIGDGNACRRYISFSGEGKQEPLMSNKFANTNDSVESKEVLQQRYRLKRFGGKHQQERYQQEQEKLSWELSGVQELEQMQHQQSLLQQQQVVQHGLQSQKYARISSSASQHLPRFEPTTSRKFTCAKIYFCSAAHCTLLHELI